MKKKQPASITQEMAIKTNNTVNLDPEKDIRLLLVTSDRLLFRVMIHRMRASINLEGNRNAGCAPVTLPQQHHLLYALEFPRLEAVEVYPARDLRAFVVQAGPLLRV